MKYLVITQQYTTTYREIEYEMIGRVGEEEDRILTSSDIPSKKSYIHHYKRRKIRIQVLLGDHYYLLYMLRNPCIYRSGVDVMPETALLRPSRIWRGSQSMGWTRGEPTPTWDYVYGSKTPKRFRSMALVRYLCPMRV